MLALGLRLGLSSDAQGDEVAATEFAVQGKVEQGKFTGALLHLKVDPKRPDVLQLERCLLPDDLALVPWGEELRGAESFVFIAVS